MSVLSQKLAQASKQFQSQNFRKSLELYQECLNFCYRTEERDTVVFNVQSAKATVEYSLGEYDTALSTLSNVLRSDPAHFLCLFRRSQVYKRQGKLRRAMKDIESISFYSPDNFQLEALRDELEQMMNKQGINAGSSSESEDDSEEEAQLNFMNLKMIDRKSSNTINFKGRNSRVTILGDQTFEYKQSEDERNQCQPKQPIEAKATRTFKQIEMDDEIQESAPCITIKQPKKKKSILRNKGTNSLIVQTEDKETRRSRYLGRESNFLTKIKDIDGRMVRSSCYERLSQQKEVDFRKSIHNQEDLLSGLANSRTSEVSKQSNVDIELKSLTLSKRKSCLKTSSFELPEQATAISRRRSKLEMISEGKIDGHILGSRRHKRFQEEGEGSDSDDDGNEHNIFGGNKIVLSAGWQQNLGGETAMERSVPLGRRQNKKSILKKNSMVVGFFGKKESILRRSTVDGPPPHLALQKLRSKKSVEFHYNQ